MIAKHREYNIPKCKLFMGSITVNYSMVSNKVTFLKLWEPKSRYFLIEDQERLEEFTWVEDSFFEEFFCFFHLFEKKSKLKGPPGPKAERLMDAAFAAKGLNWRAGSGSRFLFNVDGCRERGTTPSLPWKSLNAMSKLGPSSKIGPLAPRTWYDIEENMER